ncbi:hypothetical protein PSECIP111854_01085 [Pseudoalteromonas sp. CIP111854]|uniref:YcaO domain-containing protein n=1 Tax=Pseudoalteromonas holothuriae TaxID=2963714 RepID=A0A9W4QTQ1_9GAMM|nr:YcaO-like family protein [Pseudoalteromonas sp. CIP111854]CAH9053009.1 hypothetical protein PSECIP111854_01085 [Pseudoalteromonas sp. CIP111854]
MNARYLLWHPKFTFASHTNTKIFLSSSTVNYILDSAQLPFIQFIDGTKTASQIEKLLINTYDKSSFHYYLDYMLSTGLIHEAVSPISSELIPSVKVIKQEQCPHFAEIFNTLDIHNIIITKDISQINSEFTKALSPFIIIEDFYDNFVISPVLFESTQHLLEAYLDARLQNLPLINFISHTQARISKTYSPYNDGALEVSKHLLNNLIRHQECTVITSTREIESYYIPQPEEQPICSHEIYLKDCLINYDDDGGSRTVSAKQTVSKILPYVNRYTGLINQLSILVDNAQPIKIYKTAFYKQNHQNVSNATIDNFNQTCLGKGVEITQSKASALCEALERKNAQYRDTDVGILTTPQYLNARHYLFQSLTPYSNTQYGFFKDITNSESKRKQAAHEYNNTAIHWQPCWSLTHNESVYIPNVLCFANMPLHEEQFGCWNSNGCATGNNLEEAILQALFELIERDATAIWWYNKIKRPNFDLTQLDTTYFTPLHATLDTTHHYWVLDITNDIGIPVMAAIGKDKKTQGWTFGFGCHLKPELAAQRALTELCQLIPIRDQNSAPFNFDAIIDDYFLTAHNTTVQHYAIDSANNLKLDIINIVKRLHDLNLESVAFDYKRTESPLHTAKVFVPGLCHIWPQLGNPRLYNTPVKLGWLTEPLTEETINQQGLYI